MTSDVFANVKVELCFLGSLHLSLSLFSLSQVQWRNIQALCLQQDYTTECNFHFLVKCIVRWPSKLMEGFIQHRELSPSKGDDFS